MIAIYVGLLPFFTGVKLLSPLQGAISAAGSMTGLGWGKFLAQPGAHDGNDA